MLRIKARFEAMGEGDLESIDPRDSYNRKLVAQWSAFMLEQSYFFKNGRVDTPLARIIHKGSRATTSSVLRHHTSESQTSFEIGLLLTTSSSSASLKLSSSEPGCGKATY